MTRVSIIICTRNRASSLARTLDALGRVTIPANMTGEILVVDNASTDDTAAIVAGAQGDPRMPVRYLREPCGGQSYARNTGLAAANGNIIVFTDDDVIPAADWLVKLCFPISSGEADAVTGRIRLAPHLEHSWMTDYHRAWLASTDSLDPKDPSRMIGANMAFSRAVLAKVPAFDPELGPGAIGFGDDTLFSLQLRQAGYRIAAALNAEVEHHFDERRLANSQWLENARKMGRTDAYLSYHWENADWVNPRRHLLKAAVRRFMAFDALLPRAHPPERLLLATRHLHACLQYLRERRRSRNYTTRGLVRLVPDPFAS